MGFDFKADGIGFIEGDDTGVVDEDAQAEILVGPAIGQFHRAFEDGFSDEVCVLPCFQNVPRSILHLDIDGTLQRLVYAMLAPGLGEGFQFNIRRLALLSTEIVLDGLHFRQRKKQMAFPAQLRQLFIGQVLQRYMTQLKRFLPSFDECGGNEAVEVNRFDDAVGKDARGDAG